MPADKTLLRSPAPAGSDGAADRSPVVALVAETTETRAVAAERERIASDLHDTVGQLFVSIGLLARRYAQHLPPDSPWTPRVVRLADLADRGKWEIDRTIRALAFVPEARRGLVQSLRALARSFEADSGITVLLEIAGQPRRRSASVERALYRVTHEALTNAWLHSRCSVIRISLEFEPLEVALCILDDGIGLGPRHERPDSRVGIRTMRRALTEVGGSLRVRTARPHGVAVEARIVRAS